MKTKKLHILGGLGSGKTYLAKQLSRILNIPYFNLDNLYYSYPKNERDARFKRIISKGEWVIEGHWHDWVREGFAKADLIIFLDVSLFRRDTNLFKRLIKRTFRLEEGRQLNFKSFLEVIKLNHNWEEEKAKAAIRKYKDKTSTFYTADNALSFFKSK